MTEQHKDDAMLEQYLDGKSGISKEYNEQDKHQPTTELDSLVLSAARDAIETQVKKPKRMSKSWLVPASIAATVVLSFSLIQLQKPISLFQEAKEMELDLARAPVTVKPAPAKRVLENKLEKKKERRKVESFTPMEEQVSPQQLADAEEMPATAPLASEAPAMAVAGLLAKSSPDIESRQEVKNQRMIKTDEVVPGKEEWLRRIKTLLKDEKIDEAKKEYERFIKAYPDFVPDTELKKQLGLAE